MSFINAKIVCKSANPAEYHTSGNNVPRGDAKFVVSSSMLRMFMQCARRWKFGYESPDSRAKQFGSLLDCRALTPESFEARFSIQPEIYQPEKGEPKPWNNNATVCREWKSAQKGKEIITLEDKSLCDVAIRRLLSDEIIAAWFSESDKQVWITADWQDKDTGLLVPVKALLDFVPKMDGEFGKCLGDLKEIRSGALIPFQRQVYQLGWHIQAALYQDIYIAATGEDRNTYCFVGTENYEPFEPFKRMLSQDFIQIGRQTYQDVLKRYCRCVKTGIWPGYDDHADAIQGWSLTAPEPFMEYAALSNVLESEQSAQETDNNDIAP